MRSFQKTVLLLLLALGAVRTASLQADGQIADDGNVQMQVVADLPGQEGQAFWLQLPNDPVQVSATDRSGAPVQLLSAPNGSGRVGAIVPKDYLVFTLQSDGWTMKSDDVWVVDFGMGSSIPTGPDQMRLRLPPGAVLHGLNRKIQTPGSVLVLEWSKPSLAANETFNVSAVWDANPSDSGRVDAGTVALAALLLAGLAGGLLFWRAKAERQKKEEKAAAKEGREHGGSRARADPVSAVKSHPLYHALEPTDREIVEQIAREGGKTTQARLYLNTHLPKATLSRRLRGLENHGLVRRSRQGLRNLVSLSENWSAAPSE